MATQSNLNTRTYPASADLSADQYKFVSVNSSGEILVNVDAGAKDTAVAGILQNDPDAAGRAGTVAVGGASKVIAGAGGLALGALVTSDATGGGITATTGTIVLGICTTAAAATNIATVDMSGPMVGSPVT